MKAFAAVAKDGLVYGKDKGLNDAFATALGDYLTQRDVPHEKVTAEKLPEGVGSSSSSSSSRS